MTTAISRLTQKSLLRTLSLGLLLNSLIIATPLLAAGEPSNLADKTSSFSNDDLNISVSDADRWSAAGAVRVYKHLSYARTPAGTVARKAAASRQSTTASATAATAGIGGIVGDDFTQNPGDIAHQGGPVVQYAASHAVYLNPGGECTIASCWGDPERFLDDVGESDFIHILDEYVGLRGNQRYILGPRAVLRGALPADPLSESDLIAILHGVVARTGAGGYGNIYHLFLPPGVDTCFDAPYNNVCYSPDNPATYVFCAYHDSVTYTDLGHVLFTVQPWQGAPECADSPVGNPNSQLIDSTDDALSHEFFETISDPDGTAWWNAREPYLYHDEMADECLFYEPDHLYWAPPTFRVDGHLYRVQSEYSNQKHACAISPHD